MKVTYVLNDTTITEIVNRTAGRRRMPKRTFRGPGLGKHSYHNGVNPTRAINCGRAS